MELKFEQEGFITPGRLILITFFSVIVFLSGINFFKIF